MLRLFIAGGYSLGGGGAYSLLSSAYNMASNNVLKMGSCNHGWVTSCRNSKSALPTCNWALSSGGGTLCRRPLHDRQTSPRWHRSWACTIPSFNDSVVGNNAYWEAVGVFPPPFSIQATPPPTRSATLKPFPRPISPSAGNRRASHTQLRVEANKLLQPLLRLPRAPRPWGC